MTEPKKPKYEPIEADETPVGGEPYRSMAQDQPALSKGLTQMFGLDPRAAALVTLVDLMMIAMDVVSGGTFIIIGVGVAAYITFLVYKMQRKFFGDDHDASLIKAMIVGLLMAIPVPLTPILAVLCGITGTLQLVRRR